MSDIFHDFRRDVFIYLIVALLMLRPQKRKMNYSLFLLFLFVSFYPGIRLIKHTLVTIPSINKILFSNIQFKISGSSSRIHFRSFKTLLT